MARHGSTRCALSRSVIQQRLTAIDTANRHGLGDMRRSRRYNDGKQSA